MDLFTPGPNVPPATFDWWLAAILSLFSLAGGLVGSAMRTADRKEPFKLSLWLTEGASAGFIGMIVMLAGMGAGMKFEYLGAACGIMALIGSKAAMQVLKAIALKRANITRDDIQAAKELTDEKPN